MLSLNRDGDWNVARDVGMTTERLAMRLPENSLLAKKLLAMNQNLSGHHD